MEEIFCALTVIQGKNDWAGGTSAVSPAEKYRNLPSGTSLKIEAAIPDVIAYGKTGMMQQSGHALTPQSAGRFPAFQASP